MKKFVKLSLAAAVASTGLVSANAGALEDAIKNTSILGYATYRYDNRNLDNPKAASYNDSETNNHKIAVGLISKINEDISYTYVGAVTTTAKSRDTDSPIGYMEGGLYSVYSYFTYTGIANTSINVGQQTIDLAQTDTYDDIMSTQEGTGITVATTVGGVTLAGAYYNQSKLSGEGHADTDAVVVAAQKKDIYALIAKGSAGGVSLDANYVDIDETAKSFTIGAKASVADVKLKARYTEMDLTDAGLNENALWYVGAAYKMGALGLSADYIATAKDGGMVAFDDDAEAVNQGWALNLNDEGKTGDMFKIGASYALTSQVSLAVTHVSTTNDTAAVDVDRDETFGQLTWKPSKNFYAYVRFGEVNSDVASEEGNRGRLQMSYHF